MTRKRMAEVECNENGQVTVTHTDGTTTSMDISVWRMRTLTIKQGLEMEMNGMKLTAKAPSCYTIIREELGIRGRDKLPRYFQYCHMVGMEPSRRVLERGNNMQSYVDWCNANNQEPMIKVILKEVE